MVRPLRSLAAPLALLATLALAACASDGAPKPKLAAVASRADDRTPMRQAIDLLNEGQPDRARVVLQAILADAPQDAAARKLIDQLDRDPKLLLGVRGEPYQVRPGETMSMLAGRFLGDSLMFYALARYNGIAAPTTLQPGQMLMIPRRAKPASPPVTAKRAPTTGRAAAPATPEPVRDPAAASRLRSAALDHLNRGGVDRAVGLLRQAAQLNPDDALVKRDLDRAMRIQATVKSRS